MINNKYCMYIVDNTKVIYLHKNMFILLFINSTTTTKHSVTNPNQVINLVINHV